MTNINIFLKIKLQNGGEIKGDVGGKDHKDEILLEGFDWNVAMETAAGGTAGQAPVRVYDFRLTMKMNQASPLIMAGAATGDAVLQAVISARVANALSGGDFLSWTLSDGLLSSYETHATSESMIPLEKFSIRFRSLKLDYRPTTSEGKLGATFSTSFDLGKKK
jgi:type VI secretion system Hcp family effector